MSCLVHSVSDASSATSTENLGYFPYFAPIPFVPKLELFQPSGLGVCRAWDKSSERARDTVARQPAPTDKLLNPPRCGGKSKEKSGFRSAERCLRSLSRRIPAIPMKFPEEDMVFISKSDRLLVSLG
jgi:hypothetical protein